jgi:hypothetical protein
MVIVEHVGREGPLELISVDVLDNFLFRLLFLFLPSGAFGGAAARASGGGNSRFVFFRRLVLVSAAGLRLLYKKVPWRAASVKSRSGKFSPWGKYFSNRDFPRRHAFPGEVSGPFLCSKLLSLTVSLIENLAELLECLFEDAAGSRVLDSRKEFVRRVEGHYWHGWAYLPL